MTFLLFLRLAVTEQHQRPREAEQSLAFHLRHHGCHCGGKALVEARLNHAARKRPPWHQAQHQRIKRPPISPKLLLLETIAQLLQCLRSPWKSWVRCPVREHTVVQRTPTAQLLRRSVDEISDGL